MLGGLLGGLVLSVVFPPLWEATALVDVGGGRGGVIGAWGLLGKERVVWVDVTSQCRGNVGTIRVVRVPEESYTEWGRYAREKPKVPVGTRSLRVVSVLAASRREAQECLLSLVKPLRLSEGNAARAAAGGPTRQGGKSEAMGTLPHVSWLDASGYVLIAEASNSYLRAIDGGRGVGRWMREALNRRPSVMEEREIVDRLRADMKKAGQGPKGRVLALFVPERPVAAARWHMLVTGALAGLMVSLGLQCLRRERGARRHGQG